MAKILIFFTLALGLAGACAAADMKALNRQVDDVVGLIAGADQSASEFRKARKIHFVDVDGDGLQDAVVYFTLEGFGGGNNYSMYMAVFKGLSTGFAIQDSVAIGGNGLGAPSFARPKVNAGRMVIERFEYQDSDARCCPSKKSSVAIVLRNSKLIEDRR